MLNLTLVNFIIKAAIRDKLFIAALIIILLSSILSIFFGTAAVIEQDQFSAVFMAASLRIVAAVSMIISICFYIRRLSDDRQVEYLLSRPVSKISLILSHSAAYAAITLPLCFCVSLPILFISQKLDISMSWFWIITVYLELLIVSNAAIFFAMVLKSSFGACASTLSFYVLARLMGHILGISHSLNGSTTLMGLNKVFETISIIIPRLDLLGQSSWLIYGAVEYTQILFIIVHALLFIGLLIVATCVDLLRREF